MTSVEVKPGRPLRGVVRVPGDKSISHRAFLFAALADGNSTIRNWSRGDDVYRTRLAMEAMGVTVDGDNDELVVHGGHDRLHEPADVIDLGNSGTGFRLISGFCAARPWFSVLSGDESLRARPMMRVVEPLRRMGARIEGRDDGALPPLGIHGGGLRGIEFTPVPGTAQNKSAVLIAGLDADGDTVIHESLPGRAHTEEMLAAYGAKITTTEHADGSWKTTLSPSTLEPFSLDVPGDPSQAAFWMVAALVVPESDITIERIYVGHARSGMIDALVRMGADIELTHHDGSVADLRVRHSALRGIEVGGDEIPSLIDELPVLSIAAALADGQTVVRDAGEMRVKESDRIAAVAREIGGLGVAVSEQPDGFTIDGKAGRLIDGGVVRAGLDHRIAMTGAIAGIASVQGVTVEGWQSVETSYPTFMEDLEQLREKS